MKVDLKHVFTFLIGFLIGCVFPYYSFSPYVHRALWYPGRLFWKFVVHFQLISKGLSLTAINFGIIIVNGIAYGIVALLIGLLIRKLILKIRMGVIEEEPFHPKA